METYLAPGSGEPLATAILGRDTRPSCVWLLGHITIHLASARAVSLSCLNSRPAFFRTLKVESDKNCRDHEFLLIKMPQPSFFFFKSNTWPVHSVKNQVLAEQEPISQMSLLAGLSADEQSESLTSRPSDP